MDKIQSFEAGLNKDFSKSVQPKNTYSDALNVQLTTDAGGTNGALINFKGNQSFISISDTYAVYRLTLGTTVDTDPITINSSVSSGSFTSTSTSTGLDLYNYIIADANLIAAGLGTAWNVAAGPNYVTLWGISLNPAPSTVHSDITITTLVAAQTNLDIIGFATIREDIVLFTTNDTSSTGSYGQIWKLSYDKSQVKDSTGTPTKTLIYNQNVTFTNQYPICQAGQTVGNYENASTQRVYWTDNFNKLRKLNIADVHAMGLDPTELDTETPTTFGSPAVLQTVNNSGGVLKSGMYQCAYRLKNSSGAVTIFSEPSVWVPVYPAASSVGYELQIFGSVNVATSKSLNWEISNIDTDFDTIEIATLFRISAEGIPDINIILSEPIPTSGTYNFIYTGSELTIPVELLDYVNYATAFTHCKAITAKDNTLFAANLRNEAFDVTYDARAFRYTSSTAASPRIATIDGNPFSGITPTYPTSTADCIQTYANQRLQTVNGGQRFQQDGVTLGGQGKNISYTFTTTTHHIDSNPAAFANTAGPAYGYLSKYVNADNTPYTINSITYPMDKYSANKSPFRHCLLKGYQREEMYRFGIVFYDRSGRPSPVKWIADIVMPGMFEADSAGAVTTTFVIGDTSGYSSWAQAKNLGIIFTVDLVTYLSAADRDKITGYSIVRVKRDEDNKIIKGAGLLFPVGRSSLDAMNYNVAIDDDNVVHGNYDTTTVDIHSNAQTCATMCSPDFNNYVDNFKGFTAGDEIRIVAKANAATTTNVLLGNVGAYFRKLYTFTAPATVTRQEIALDQAEMCAVGERNAVDLINTPGFFDNITKDVPNTVVPTAATYSLGNNTLFLETDNINIDYATDTVNSGSSKFYAYYYRPLAAQYGGATYAQRANSEYIFCGHFQPITNALSYGSTTATTYGGDVFINSHDYQKLIANFQTGPATKRSATWWFTVETTTNTDLQYDPTVNANGLTLTSTGIDYYGEQYYIPNCLKVEQDVRKYYSLPVTFTATTTFDTRIAYSQIKIAGETIDNWGVFKPNDFYDVESPYGPINNILVVKDKFLGWQNKGFFELAVNPTAVIQDTSGAELQLGTGTTIQNHNYITTEGGSKHQWGMALGPDSVYWFDAIKRKMWQFSGQGLVPLSDIKGMHGWFNETLRGRVLTKDNPVWLDTTSGSENGVCATYDFENNRVFMTFLDSTVGLAGDVYTTVKNTITYNEQFDCFESFHSFYPTMYINDGHIILTRNPTSSSTYKNLFIHNLGNYGTYYGTTYDSTVELVANEGPAITKVFDNLEWHTEVVDNTTTAGTNININNLTFDRLRVYNDHQNSDWRTLVVDTDLKRRERSWRTACPRNRVLYTSSASPNIFTDLNPTNKTAEERIRDKYAVIGLKFLNTSNRALTFHWLKYLFRVSPR